ncbi:hypothetical protein BTZ20_2605 [Rhodococcus sp. MTM3W5.2]|uniref:DUF2784 domain-containing protein n=1 Tax=Rhodococcus sp. MTM3W5.2 TaxID=1805827 RepID=UPI0009797E89|nr:DUF2784 domain-containing protein [Rhodococcus sp. MTM3W5.2]AQA20707.1 hypothetical protein BTZ20_2605 [Rhodococcus sp. MTM3W5.2]
MVFRVLAEATMTVHFAFLVYVVAGGFLAWRWPWAIWPHLVLAGWGFSTIVFGFDCPLTHLENWARHEAGEQGLRTGFIDTYLTGVVYPERYTTLLQMLAGLVVLVSWTGFLIRRRHPTRARVSAPS